MPKKREGEKTVKKKRHRCRTCAERKEERDLCKEGRWVGSRGGIEMELIMIAGVCLND